MAIIIKVLDQGTKRPKSGVSVSFMSKTGWGKEKWTDKDGCVSYALDPFMATILTIKDTKKSEQRLGTGENVFYIWVVIHFSVGKSGLDCEPLFVWIIFANEKVGEIGENRYNRIYAIYTNISSGNTISTQIERGNRT